jgi:hypothetical protein
VFSKDENNVYYTGSVIDDCIANNFRNLEGAYYTDGEDIFYLNKKLGVSSVNSFKLIHLELKNEAFRGLTSWSTDGKHYYHFSEKVPSNDFNNITLYANGFAKDTQHVYQGKRNIMYNNEGTKILDTIDIASFKLNSSYKPEDKFGPINVFHGRKTPWQE